MIVPKHYENLRILHENTLPNRCYYIPASKPMQNLVEHREESDRFQLLNGDWKFRYYDSIYDLQDKFYEVSYDVNEFDTIPVPGMWQNYGYDKHQYTNQRYPIPFDPPYVPQDNPCGAYTHEFDYKKDEKAPKSYLIFEGVDSCFYVWLNGTYVGYSQVSHSTSEFDVTEFLKDGKNRLSVLVLKWCDGTYMEDQDKFRMTGIFRDVYLLNRPEEGIFDYFITTQQMENSAEISIRFTYLGQVVPTNIRLYDAQGVELLKRQIKEEEVVLKVDNPILWNPEHPYLYTVVFETDGEVITDRIGIREIGIRNKQVVFNGTPIIFRGVNRHDSDPVTGYVVSIEHVKRDLRMMREHNFNAIRSSHYPNIPQFYQLCDEYGFLVVDESDNEGHGPVRLFHKENTKAVRNGYWHEPIADNPEFIESIVDRMQRCVERDKNRPCVVIWSLGNECAYGCGFEAAAKWTKEFDSTRLTQYESAMYHGDKRKYDFSNLDLFSRMYPPFEEIDEYLDSNPDKPFIMIEYCHAMGNGPGDFEDHFQKIHSNPLMCGGFVWEWCDHGIFAGKSEDGKDKYLYGGDSGEILHDGNFCMDGLVYPDRRPHTGLLEYKNVYRPIRVESYDSRNGEICFRNYLEFTDAKDYIQIKYEVSCDGAITDEGTIETPSIPALSIGTARLALEIPQIGKTFLKVSYYSTKETALVPAGHLLGFDEIQLENEDSRVSLVTEANEQFGKSTSPMNVEETDRSVVVSGENFRYVLDKRTGLFESLIYDGKEQIERPMELNIWRAPTDNDRFLKAEWARARYKRTYTRSYETFVEQEASEILIRSTVSMAADSLQKVLDINTEWRIDGSGTISLCMEAKKNPEFPMLPRFGIRMFLNKEMDQVSYYGLGPMESYCDKRRAASYGIHNATVEELHEDYLRPQENGSHAGCSYVTVTNGKTQIKAMSEKEFSFNASVYTQEELQKKMHNFELQPSGYTVLCLDYAQNGIGSDSCGQDLLPQYRLDFESIVFDMKLKFE